MIQHRHYFPLSRHRGAPRIWLDGPRLRAAGAMPGTPFLLHFDAKSRSLLIEINEKGNRRVSGKGPDFPVVDINCRELAATLGEVKRLKAVFEPGRIFITVHPDELAAEERRQRVQKKIEAGSALTVGSIFHGGGIMDAALEDGFRRGGVETEMGFAIEVNDRFLSTSLRNNPVWRSGKGIAICASADEVEFDSLPKVDVLQGGIPCSGASLSGRARRRLANAESHPDVGHLFVTFLDIVKATQPGVIIMENVVPYQNTASWVAIRALLRVWGYDLHETVLDGNEMGALESRKRLCAVAVTQGLDFSWDGLTPVRVKEESLGEILDPTADGWSQMAGLKAKEARDHAKYSEQGNGTGFKMQIADANSPSVPTVCKDYYKVRSTEVKVRHPQDPALLRQLTVAEHLRVKAVPEALVAGECLTIAHQILGQGVIFPAFQAVGQQIALCLRGLSLGVRDAIKAVEGAAYAASPATVLAPPARETLQLALF